MGSAPLGAVNGRGWPAWRMGLNGRDEEEPVEGFAQRVERRADSAADQAHKRDPLAGLRLPEPLTDPSREGMHHGFHGEDARGDAVRREGQRGAFVGAGDQQLLEHVGGLPSAARHVAHGVDRPSRKQM